MSTFPYSDQDFSLVLSGGGALGFAHLGVIEDLEIKSIIPKEIIGTSMGGIIGACLSIGLKEKEISNLLYEFVKISNWLKFSFDGNSIVKTSKIEKIFDKIFGNIHINQTKIPLKIIATNLETANSMVFDDKHNIKIKDALLATMAIPGIFEEKIINNVVYVDGFLSQNLGVNAASYQNIVAVDVLGKNSFDFKLPNNFLKTKNVFDMFEKSLRILMYNQTRNLISQCNKNIYLIEPLTKNYKTFHFHKIDEIKTLGKGLL